MTPASWTTRIANGVMMALTGSGRTSTRDGRRHEESAPASTVPRDTLASRAELRSLTRRTELRDQAIDSFVTLYRLGQFFDSTCKSEPLGSDRPMQAVEEAIRRKESLARTDVAPLRSCLTQTRCLRAEISGLLLAPSESDEPATSDEEPEIAE